MSRYKTPEQKAKRREWCKAWRERNKEKYTAWTRAYRVAYISDLITKRPPPASSGWQI